MRSEYCLLVDGRATIEWGTTPAEAALSAARSRALELAAKKHSVKDPQVEVVVLSDGTQDVKRYTFETNVTCTARNIGMRVLANVERATTIP